MTIACRISRRVGLRACTAVSRPAGRTCAEGAITAAPTGSIARQHVGPGEILTDNDVVGSMSDTVPVGWRTVAVAADERTLEVSTGDRVDVVADGVVLAADGLVIARQTSTVVVAVPAELAPLVAVAALDGRAVLVGRA